MMSLQLLERNPLIWKGRDYVATSNEKIATGYVDLDTALNGGLPTTGAISLCTHLQGVGELSLFAELLRAKQDEQKLTIFINPPASVNGPWLLQQHLDPQRVYQVATRNEEETLWASEQCLRSEACSTVLTWTNQLTHKQARRLQVAASHHHTLLVLYRAQQRQHQVMPVNIDLSLTLGTHGLLAHIHKQIGGWAKSDIPIALKHIPSNRVITQLMNQGRALASAPLDLAR